MTRHVVHDLQNPGKKLIAPDVGLGVSRVARNRLNHAGAEPGVGIVGGLSTKTLQHHSREAGNSQGTPGNGGAVQGNFGCFLKDLIHSFARCARTSASPERFQSVLETGVYPVAVKLDP